MGLYVEVQYRGDWWGEEPLTETVYETTGDLFRSLAGIDKARPWEALGRCTGKVYVDVPGSPCTLCHKTRGEHEHNPTTNPITTRWEEPSENHPHGAVMLNGHYYQSETRQVGWVFVARNPEPVNRGDEQPTGLREAWVTVHEKPPTISRTVHYASFGSQPIAEPCLVCAAPIANGTGHDEGCPVGEQA
jgi:hypothetical protein